MEFMLAHETVLYNDLRARGEQLYFEPRARVRHLNISRLSSMLRAKYYSGRLFGAARSGWRQWPTWRRLAFALAGPFVGAARVRYAMRHVDRLGQRKALLPGVLLPLLAGLVMHSLGEGVGALFGPGEAARAWTDYEFARRNHLNAKDEKIAVAALDGAAG